MIKVLIASGVAVSAAALASPALADVYINPEFNGGSYGDEYLGGTLTMDVGYEVSKDNWSFYVQGGPALVMPDGAEEEFELAGKFGGSVGVTENLAIYGELSGITGEDELSWGTKLGAKYSF